MEQMITIPSDHRVFFEFLAPKEIPAGPAKVELKVTPVIEKKNKPEPNISKDSVFSKGSATPISDSLLGILSHVGDITIEKIREERLTNKYLK